LHGQQQRAKQEKNKDGPEKEKEKSLFKERKRTSKLPQRRTQGLKKECGKSGEKPGT